MTKLECPDCGEEMTYAKLLKHVVRDHLGTAGGNKFNARKVELDGRVFDSALESQRYLQLKMLESAGEIRDLELQPRFPCVVNGKHVCLYTADFRYFDVQKGETVIEDAKGVRTEAYVVRKKLAEALYGIQVIEITKEML